MYSELLGSLYARNGHNEAAESPTELVLVLHKCRHRLRSIASDHDHKIAEDLALELDHDRTLLWLCSAMGIDHDPLRFSDRYAERRHLEEELRRRGVSLNELEDETHFHNAAF
jgi:hypothetical protein